MPGPNSHNAENWGEELSKQLRRETEISYPAERMMMGQAVIVSRGETRPELGRGMYSMIDTRETAS